MSQLHNVIEYQFHNRKPSKTQIMSCIRNAIKDGGKAISISWGENCIDLNVNPYHSSNRMGLWFGSGWIKNIGGSDLADELNRMEDKK